MSKLSFSGMPELETREMDPTRLALQLPIQSTQGARLTIVI